MTTTAWSNVDWHKVTRAFNGYCNTDLESDDVESIFTNALNDPNKPAERAFYERFLDPRFQRLFLRSTRKRKVSR